MVNGKRLHINIKCILPLQKTNKKKNSIFFKGRYHFVIVPPFGKIRLLSAHKWLDHPLGPLLCGISK